MTDVHVRLDERRGFVRGTWGMTESNHKTRFYALTPPAAAKPEWKRMVTTMRAMPKESS